MHTQRVSFDFDNCLQHGYVQLMLERFYKWEDDVYVVTTRNPIFDNLDLFEITDELGIPRENIHFTNFQLKLDTLLRLGINLHFDDDQTEVDDINRNGGESIRAVLVEYKMYY